MIYICIPTHNEQQTVGVVLWKLRQVLTEFPRDYQLLVADDASTDKTPQVLEPYTRVLPLTVIRSDQRRGYAASLEMLLREAIRRSEYPKRDVIVAMQADFSDEPDDVVALVKRLEAGADVAVGNKVSTTKESRTRRFARMLSHFFTRRQTWPEGVVTPFDGYRAYRLYAVKRAIEEREGQRLLRYDGWASQAELLRAVLPHARRVDVVDVEDRTDRLQRPRRERPFAAAMQVRGMARNTAPRELLGVEELDRTAATASRSRERATAAGNGGQNGRSSGRRDGERRETRGGEGARHRHGGADARPGQRQKGGPEGEKRQGRTRDAGPGGQRPPRADRSERSDRPQGRTGERRPEPRDRRPGAGPHSAREEPAAAAGVSGEEEALVPVSADSGAGPGQAEPGEPGAAPPKRRRRKRSRGRGAASAGSQGGTDSAAEAGMEAAGEESPEGSAMETGEAAGAGRKRRRRGGRRGGRGRRTRAEGAEHAEAQPASESGPAPLEPVAVESTPPRGETD